MEHHRKPDFMGCNICQWNITGTLISWDVMYVTGTLISWEVMYVNGISRDPWFHGMSYMLMEHQGKPDFMGCDVLYNFEWFVTTWLFDFSNKSPKTAKIETKLLPVSAKISCDAWLMNYSKLYSMSMGHHRKPELMGNHESENHTLGCNRTPDYWFRGEISIRTPWGP